MSDLSSLAPALRTRAGDRCELCGAEGELAVLGVPPGDADAERALLACATCRAWVETGEVEARHAHCLREAAWSEVPAVQVTAWRLLGRLDEGWARDLLDQMYLDEDTLAWARQGVDQADAQPTVMDAHGTPLADGDTVTLIKDLDVKGGGFTAKRGTTVKGIRLTEDDPEHVEGRVNGVSVYLKACFLKKA